MEPSLTPEFEAPLMGVSEVCIAAAKISVSMLLKEADRTPLRLSQASMLIIAGGDV